MDRLNHKFNRPEATVILHKEIKLIFHEQSNLLRLQILPWRGSLTRHVQFLQKKFTEANYFALELKKQKKLSHTKFKLIIA